MNLTQDEKIYYGHIGMGALMGIVCGYLGSGSLVGILGIGALFLFWESLKRALKLEKDNKWWLGNGIWPYSMFWLFFWALTYYLV